MRYRLFIVGLACISLMLSLFLFIKRSSVSKNDGLPSLSQYQTFLSTTTKPLLLSSHPIGAEYKTAISDAYSQGINYAGHYVIATWGCGTNCQKGAIVDASTGNILGQLPFIAENGISVVATSSLLIENPPEYALNSGRTSVTRYWLLEEGEFKPIAAYIISSTSTEPTTLEPKDEHLPEWVQDSDCMMVGDLTTCK